MDCNAHTSERAGNFHSCNRHAHCWFEIFSDRAGDR